MISAHEPMIQVRGHTIGRATMIKGHENIAKDDSTYRHCLNLDKITYK